MPKGDPMSEAGKDELKQYADGWMTETKGSDVPGFLKLAFPVIGLCATAYIVLQMYGDVGHATRGPLVAQFIKATETSPGLQYAVMALALVYVAITVAFVFRPFKED